MISSASSGGGGLLVGSIISIGVFRRNGLHYMHGIVAGAADEQPAVGGHRHFIRSKADVNFRRDFAGCGVDRDHRSLAPVADEQERPAFAQLACVRPSAGRPAVHHMLRGGVEHHDLVRPFVADKHFSRGGVNGHAHQEIVGRRCPFAHQKLVLPAGLGAVKIDGVQRVAVSAADIHLFAVFGKRDAVERAVKRDPLPGGFGRDINQGYAVVSFSTDHRQRFAVRRQDHFLRHRVHTHMPARGRNLPPVEQFVRLGCQHAVGPGRDGAGFHLGVGKVTDRKNTDYRGDQFFIGNDISTVLFWSCQQCAKTG